MSFFAPPHNLHFNLRNREFKMPLISIKCFMIVFLLLFQFCKNFRVGERCCEFECLDPPGEDNMYQVNLSFPFNEKEKKYKRTKTFECLQIEIRIFQWRLKKRDEILAGMADADKNSAKALTITLSTLTIIIMNKILMHRLS